MLDLSLRPQSPVLHNETNKYIRISKASPAFYILVILNAFGRNFSLGYCRFYYIFPVPSHGFSVSFYTDKYVLKWTMKFTCRNV